MSDSCSTATAYHGGGAGSTAVHPDIIQTHILTRLDVPTLASTSCASSQLRSICTEESLWKNICNSNWPSATDPRVQEIISTFPSGHRSFCSDSYSTIQCLRREQQHHHHHNSRPKSKSPQQEPIQTRKIMFAIDIHYADDTIFSKVVVKETLTGWFRSSPLRLDLLDTKDMVPIPAEFDDEETCMARMEKNMKLSWILVDPLKKRAVNLSSLRPVDVRRHWLAEQIQVRYATIMAARIAGGFVTCTLDITCGAEKRGDLHVREISMVVEDLEGRILSGQESLEILQEAMDGKRVYGKIGEEKKIYETFMEKRLIWRKRRQEMERKNDLVRIASGFTILITFWILIKVVIL